MLSRDVEVMRQMPLVSLPVRTSRVVLGDTAVLISPASTLTREQVEAFGPIDAVVSPNLFHTEGLEQACAAFPRAELWGPPGARERRPALPWTGIFGTDPWPHETKLRPVRLGGMPKMNEVVFLDVDARTLHVGDLVFNLPRAQGLGARLFFGMCGTDDRFAMSRMLGLLVKDKAAFRASVEAVLALDFDRLVPAHGAHVASGAREKLRAAMMERGYA